MRKSDKIDVVFTELEKRYAGATTELIYETPFQLLVAVVMSAQTTDKQVNRVTEKFFDRVRVPADVCAMTIEQRTACVQGVNYAPTKAKNLYRTAHILRDEYDSAIPQTQEELMLLYGVGEKTAKVILHVLYDQPVIAVDTHVHRVCNRLGIVKTDEPLQTSRELERIIPDTYKQNAHHGLILFGRYHCTARNPKCGDCPFVNWCPAAKIFLKKK